MFRILYRFLTYSIPICSPPIKSQGVV
jgi:hypothetical protein